MRNGGFRAGGFGRMAGMVAWVFSIVLLAAATVGAVRAGLREADFLRARRHGVELQAEVLDNDASPTGNMNQYLLTPVVRYHLDGRAFVGSVLNASGVPGERGASMTIVVRREDPSVPYDRYGGLGVQARGRLAVFAVAVAVFVVVAATH